MKIVEITDDKIGMMTDCVEKMLRYGGKIMSCLEELEGAGEQYGERYGSRDPYSHPDYNQGAPMYGERRGRDGRGRYM